MDNQQLQEKVNKISILKNQADVAGALEATQGLVLAAKEEIGDYKVTREMRKKAAKELGVDEKTASGWQRVVDILDHIDTVEFAKKHPDEINKGLKAAANVVGSIIPLVGKIGGVVPEKLGSKAVQLAGYLAPEHLLNTFAKHQVKKKVEKQKKGENNTAVNVENTEETKKVKVRVKRVTNNTAQK